jgi:hypothetical protein
MDAFRIEFLNYLEAEPGTLQYDLEALETAPPPFSTLDDVVILRVGQTQMGVILTGDQQWVLVVSNELPAPYWAELTDELIAQFNIHMSALFHLPALPPTGEMDAGLIEGSVDPSDLPAEAVGVPPVDEAKPDTSPRVETAGVPSVDELEPSADIAENPVEDGEDEVSPPDFEAAPSSLTDTMDYFAPPTPVALDVTADGNEADPPPPTDEGDAGLIESDAPYLPAEAVEIPPVDELEPPTDIAENPVEDESPEPNRGLLGRFFPSANGQTPPDDVSPDEDEAGTEGETEQVPLADLQNLEEQPPMSVHVARATNGHGE